MKIALPSWHALTRNTAPGLKAWLHACALLLGLFAVPSYLAHVREVRSASQLHNVEIQSAAAQARLQEAEQRLANVRAYLAGYDDLKRKGVLRPADRAVNGDWFDHAIGALQSDAIESYVIGKEQAYTGAELAGLTAFRVISRRLDFSAFIRHEDEFAALMNTLAERLPGVAAFEGCQLTREARRNTTLQGLAASCSIVWYVYQRNDATVAALVPGRSS